MTIKIILGLFGLIILYVGIELGVLYFRQNHLPKLPTIDQSDRVLGNGPKLRYIAAGDSTAVGYGASDVSKTYAFKVAEFLAQSSTVEYKNIAVIGFKTQDVLDKQVQQIIDYKPDVVTISMGANDATHLVSQKKILENYKSIIEKLKQGTSAKIYITDVANFDESTILPWFYYRLIEYRSSKINPKLLGLESDRVKIINIHDFGWSNYVRKDTYAADHFHPNNLGYENWTNAFLDKIKTDHHDMSVTRY